MSPLLHQEGEDKEDKQGQYARRGSSGRFFMLTEHEEELVERILQVGPCGTR